MIVFLKSHPATRTMIGGDPTPEQAASGDYPKLRQDWHGLTVAIEHPEGTVREGVDETGKPWRTVFRYAYGEILGTLGMDGDPVDVFIGSYPDAPEVYVVQQMKRKQWDVADEQKCMINFASIDEARDAYLGHYDDPRFFGGITAMPVAEFIAKVRATRKAPAMIKALLLKTHVNGYTKKDGTFVPPHEDKRQSLEEDLQRQEKWLHSKAQDLGYRDIEHMLESDYPAFERLAAEWREQNPVEVAMKSMVVFFKAHVGPYLRNGKMVNMAGYQGRNARAVPVPGQISLFGGPSSGKPLPPSPLQGKDAVAHTPDLFEQTAAPAHPVDTPQFRRWFDGSKVVDADGKPLVVYHGTAADIERFDPERIGSATDEGLYGAGFYFTPKHGNGGKQWGTAGQYAADPDGGNIIPAYLSIQRPIVVDAGQWGRVDVDRSKYDGVIVKDQSGAITELVAFRPEQIKSATGNNGDFDPGNPVITKSSIFLRGPES